MTHGRAAAFALGFAGILVSVRPGFIEISEGILIMLVCTFLFGATGAVTKWLTRRETAVAITFYMVLMQAVFGAAASTFVWEPLMLQQAPWLLLMGRSEERSVGKECVSTGRSRWSQCHSKTN